MNNELSKEIVDELAQEILQILDIILESLSELDEEPQRELMNSLYRGFHNIKGNANLAGLSCVSELAYKLEDIISLIRAGVLSVDGRLIESFLKSAGVLMKLVEDMEQDSTKKEAESLLDYYNELASKITSLEQGDLGEEESDNSSYQTGLEDKEIDEDVAAGVSVGGGGVALELNQNDPSQPLVANNATNNKAVPKNAYRPLRILIVEDDFTSRQLLVAALSKYGECHVAKDGLEAVQAVEKTFESDPMATYDLICMDVQMPNMDGTAAVRAIRDIEHDKDVEGTEFESAIIMISCVEDPKVIMKSCYKCGANHYFVKPLDLNQMNRQMCKLNLISVNNSPVQV